MRAGLPPDLADEWFSPALAQHAATLARALAALAAKAVAALKRLAKTRRTVEGELELP